MQISSKKTSLYVTLGLIIISTVTLIIFIHSAYNYSVTKDKIVQQMKSSSKLTIESLQKSVTNLIASYSVDEYESLVFNEIEHRDIFAIVVEDFKMGKILGKKAYISGKIRDEKLHIHDYDVENAEQTEALKKCYYSDTYDIFSSEGEKLGSIAIYISDYSMLHELNAIVTNTLLHAFIMSVLLILSLFITIRFFILKPISSIVSSIDNSDEDGIPLSAIPNSGSQEVSALTNKMNEMISSIKNSRMELREHHEYLQSIINCVEDPIMVIKPDYTIELMNDAVRNNMQKSMIADPEHPKCYEVSHHRFTPCSGENHFCPLKEVIQTNQNRTILHNHSVDDIKYFVELSVSPLFDAQRKCIGVVESARNVTAHLQVQDELREQKNFLDYQAHHDALTGLANRVLFNDRLEQSIEKSKRNNTKMALLFIDLDHFKEINDSLGHKAGDKVLKTVTHKLEEAIRKEDTLARLGGDEFTVIIEGLKTAQDASLLAEKILKTLSASIIIDDTEVYIGCSIGISLYPDNGDIPQDLLKYADAAMYKAKSEGRNNFQYYSAEMTAQAFERVAMETNLRTGLKNEEFVVYYQPQVDAQSGALTGMEALVRWQSPSMGLIPPSKFIPLAESTGLIVELDRFVMKSAMTQIAAWYKEGLNPGVLAMNLTIKQLQQKDFINVLENLIAKTGCLVGHLELEVTEGQIMTHPEEAIKILNKINQLGVKLAIDDFGTGYSSLSYLKKLPISKLKIDQSFIRDLPEDEEDAAITKAVIALAQSLNLRIIAEGVETLEQKEFLVQNGCENIQGYFYAKPMPADEMHTFLFNRAKG